VPVDPKLEAMLEVTHSQLAWSQFDLEEAERSAVRAPGSSPTRRVTMS
jgi:hypothetical protein